MMNDTYNRDKLLFIWIILKDSILEDYTFISVLYLVSTSGSIHVLSFPRKINNGESFYLNVNGGFCAVMSNVHGSRNLFLPLM